MFCINLECALKYTTFLLVYHALPLAFTPHTSVNANGEGDKGGSWCGGGVRVRDNGRKAIT